MPSSQLTQLVRQIDAQDTDHFGKFYIYVALLNSLTRGKTFAQGLPTYSSFFRDTPLNIGGELPADFTRQLESYRRGFNTDPHWSKAAQEIVWSYFRKGKVSDLVYIIDQMRDHLTAIVAGPSNPNHTIYSGIGFEGKKAGMIAVLEQISTFNHQLLAQADRGVNAALCVLLTTTALALALSFSLIPVLIGLVVLPVAAYGIYYHVTNAKAQTAQLKSSLGGIMSQMQQLPRDESLFGDRNFSSFYAAALRPLPYAAVTALEQISSNEAQAREYADMRTVLDRSMPVG